MTDAEPTLSQVLSEVEALITGSAPGTASPGPPAGDGPAVDRLRRHPGLTGADPELALRAARALSAVGTGGDLPAVAELAAEARGAGVDGAGPILAEATDKLLLLQGLPQRFGTVMFEHQGEVVQPVVDPSTTDAERADMGLPTMAEMNAGMAEASRIMARERAKADGWLPPGQPFCRVWTDPTPDRLRARMVAEGASAWSDGDVITFVAESDVPVAVHPVFPISSWSAGDGLQVLSVRVARLDEAVITYTFTPMTGGAAMDLRRGSHHGRFRGPKAPEELPSNDPLTGSLTDHRLDSPSLGEDRAVTVYRPEGHRPGDEVPVVYATDGNMFAPYARRLDAAIQAGTCPPVVIVAAHSAPMTPAAGNLRAMEYLMGFDDRTFDAHQRFFITELATWAETEIGVARHPERRAVFGCSDGGGHALAVAQLHPHMFGHVFAFSTGMAPDPSNMATTSWDPGAMPFIHLCAGTLEGPFHQATAAWAGFLGLAEAPHRFTERVAGHDLIQWCEEFPRAVARAWG